MDQNNLALGYILPPPLGNEQYIYDSLNVIHPLAANHNSANHPSCFLQIFCFKTL